MNWSNYELGRFYGKHEGKVNVACIQSTDVANPPATFEPFKSYTADESGISKFIEDLFVRGIFTEGKPLNTSVGDLTENFYQAAQRIAGEVARKFRQARFQDSTRFNDEANRFFSFQLEGLGLSEFQIQ